MIAAPCPTTLRRSQAAANPGTVIGQHVDITPHVSLLSKMGQAGHSVAEAVAELVDNAIDARGGDQVVVEVEYSAKDAWLRVRDDGQGMSRQDLANALVLGQSSKAEEDIGRFGLGMKTACTALGSRFQVATCKAEATYEWIADYDEAEFVSSGAWTLPLRRRLKNRPTGTEIRIWSDRVYPNLHQSLARNLGWTFRHFLRDEILRLTVNGQSIDAAGYQVDPGSVMPFEGMVAGRRVHGWAGLLLKSSQRGWYGFSLVRHRRIVRRHEKLGFQAHPSTARVVGELHLDHFDTNNLKTNFIRETAEWRLLEQWVSETIEPVLAASRKLAHAGMLDLKIRARINEQRAELLGTDDPEGALALTSGTTNGSLELDVPPVAVAVGPLHLEHRWAWGQPDDEYIHVKRSARPGEADLLTVTSNLAHPLYSALADHALWACHNLAEAAARALGPPAQFVTLKGVVLARLLQEKALRRALADRQPVPEADVVA